MHAVVIEGVSVAFRILPVVLSSHAEMMEAIPMFPPGTKTAVYGAIAEITALMWVFLLGCQFLKA